MPRPELSSALGVSYRRIPVLAIGNDVYCDTSLIASALERNFPPEQGYGTLYPNVKGLVLSILPWGSLLSYATRDGIQPRDPYV
jgi:glutathione S-transferase